MKIHACKYLLLLPLLSLPASAQKDAPKKPVAAKKAAPTKKGAHDGHDHGPKGRAKGESEVDFLWRKSDEAFHDGDYNLAISYHRRIVAADSHDIRSWSVASWLMWSLGRGDEATAWIDKGLKANARDWEMWSEAGQQAELQKLGPRALKMYKKALTLVPKDADKQQAQLLRRRLAHTAEKNGERDLSLQTWRDLVRDYPAEPVNRNNLARVESLPK